MSVWKVGEGMSARRAIYLPAALTTLIVLSLSLVSCLPEQSDVSDSTGDSTDGPARTEAQTLHERTTGSTGGTSSGAQPDPRQALVPIAHLSSQMESVTTEELLQNQDLLVAKESAQLATEQLGAGASEVRNTRSHELDHDSETVERVSRTPGSIGLVPWDAVTPEVTALAVEGVSVLESEGQDSRDYPLASDAASKAQAAPTEGPDPEKLRRVVVGGDVVMDRGMVYTTLRQNKGLQFPLDGGYAAITKRTPQQSGASEFGVINKFEAERRGESGAVREYLNAADLTLANLENPIVQDATWHPNAPMFTGDPQLLPVLEDAGLDGVTLANNHMLDAGASGIGETRNYLREAGISYAGAGEDLDESREPMVFDLDGLKIGVLSYQGVPYYEWIWAGEQSPGTAPLQKDLVVEDVRELKNEVDVVMVMPHWGAEYTATPEPQQMELARAATEAGADLVVGGHAHWPKGMEVRQEKPIFYGTGNFLFDQSWSLETSTGIFAEITLYEERVIQAKPVPFVILDRSQPNFLLPQGGGNQALEKIYASSLGEEFEAYDSSPR